MRVLRSPLVAACAAMATMAAGPPEASASKLTLVLDNGREVRRVGAFRRWDEDGNPRKPVNPKAKIDSPEVDFWAQRGERGAWVFPDLPAGRWDLVIMVGDRVRIEGFDYPPVLEFDAFFSHDTPVDEETRDSVFDDIRKSRHYENKVVPLSIAGDGKNSTVRVLVMLIRDQETSYEADMAGAATIRHEIWQYTNRYGGWAKERRTRVMDRLILPRDELRKWTWVWEPRLGAIVVEESPVTIQYTIPADFSAKKLPGLYPY